MKISCYHPLKAFILSVRNDGKKNVKITSYNTDHLEINPINNVKIEIKDNKTQFPLYHRVDDYVEVPCGHCLGCRLDYSRMWSCRLICELQTQPAGSRSFFVTLTYNDENIPCVDSNFRDSPQMFTLRKKHIQDFMKSLRKRFPENRIRFYCAGEYSPKFRPHYHMILYNVPLDDLKVHTVKNGNIYYTSLLLDSIWKKGYTLIGEVTAESCGYVAQYCLKKAFSNLNTDYEELGIEKEFILMSRRPGIGADWLEKHKDLLSSPVINLSTSNGGRQFTIPRYYMDKLAVLDKNKDFVELLKEQKHKYYLDRISLEDSLSDKPRLERLSDMERFKEKKVRKERDPFA